MKNTRGIVFLAGVLLAAGGALRLSGATEISTQSPFTPRAGSGISTVTENPPVELRGILKSDAGPVFGLYDPVKKQGGWLKLSEPGKDFLATVKNYDAPNDAITVEYQGRTLNLVLKSAKIETAPAIAMVSPRPMPAPGQPAVAPAPSADDTRRLEAVAAEVARRRQARQAAAQQQQQPQPVAQPAQNVPNRQR